MWVRRAAVAWRRLADWPLARGLLQSLVSAGLLCWLALSSPPTASAKPFAFGLPAGWSLARLVGERERREPAAGVKPYSGRRIANESLRMIYYHDQTVSIVELGPDKLLLNCELIEVYDENDGRNLLQQLKHINRPLEITFLQMIKLMSQCQQVKGVEAHDEMEIKAVGGSTIASIWKDDTDAKTRLDSGGAHVGLLGGSPLSLLQGIIPGTKWCGTGDIAIDYHDLGADRRMDRCCRTHDLCPTKVRAFSKRYNLTNNSIYSKSHCVCDDMLFDCLKATNTSAAELMGQIYFNLVQVPCVEEALNGTRQFRIARPGF